jgi:hypothetical protein
LPEQLTLPLSEQDKLKLRNELKKRWKNAFKRLCITYAIPVGLSLIFALCSIDDLPDLFWHFLIILALWSPILLIILLVNLILFIGGIPTLYIDIWRNRKKAIPFNPQRYSILESNKYYMQTGLPQILFIEISEEQYYAITGNELFYYEITPIAKVPLGIRYAEKLDTNAIFIK